VRAIDQGKFDEEFETVGTPEQPKGVRVDEGPRRETSLKKLATLKPAFKENGTVTAGNSSGINDGAAALLLLSEGMAESTSLRPIARVLGTATAGVHPSYMGLGPVPATKKLLRRIGMKLDDFGVIELNEAFAAQVLACVCELPEFGSKRVNPNGGAIALGHPIGCSGARIAVTLVHEMRRRRIRYGLATMCIGVGQGIATAFELVG
jgi:acetyl-CoA acetyltransferase family protein